MKKIIAGALAAGAIALGVAAPAQAGWTSSSTLDAVCAQLEDHNSADGVLIVILQMRDQGYSDKQIVSLLVGAVKTVCPQYKAAVVAFADKYGE